MTPILAYSLDVLAGQVLVGGFDGLKLPATSRERLAAGYLGGITLFARNVADVHQVAALNRSIVAAAPEELPPLIAVDQEGGRVARLKAPILELPPMRAVGQLADPALTEQIGVVLGGELCSLGFNCDFAPVCDVDSNPDNPVIGDRAFSRDPDEVTRHAVAFIRGLQSAGVSACAKHFPGHGDTCTDSHLELPRLDHDRARLQSVELPPFRAAVGAGVAAVMTAHVVCQGVDPERPATLSPTVLGILRRELGFEGVIISDDLNMRAIDLRPAEAAVAAILAGCDAVLVCKDEERQEEARRGLCAEATRSPSFADRLRQAASRVIRMRRANPPRPSKTAAETEAALTSPLRFEVERRLLRTAAGRV